MNRSKIEWAKDIRDSKAAWDWSILIGCLRGCSYCWARTLTERFPRTFPNGFKPLWYPERLGQPANLHVAGAIFVAPMADLFGDWVPDNHISDVIRVAGVESRHTFIFLTKYPARLLRFKFPRNAWVGITIDRLTRGNFNECLEVLRDMDEPGVRFLNFEPLLLMDVPPGLLIKHADWVIVGAQTNPEIQPDRDTVEVITYHCSLYSKPLFHKDNLRLPEEIKRRQEFPVVRDE